MNGENMPKTEKHCLSEIYTDSQTETSIKWAGELYTPARPPETKPSKRKYALLRKRRYRVVFVYWSTRKNPPNHGEYDSEANKIYIYIYKHIEDAWNPEQLALALNDTFLHELLHSVNGRLGDRQIEWCIARIHMLLGDF